MVRIMKILIDSNSKEDKNDEQCNNNSKIIVMKFSHSKISRIPHQFLVVIENKMYENDLKNSRKPLKFINRCKRKK
jgi:hypothetical protein